MTTKCDKCQLDNHKSSETFYKDEIDVINTILHHREIYINDITLNILGYIYNTAGHTITYSVKQKGGECWYPSNICTKCFQYGIYTSLQNQNRLPFLRNDIYYFLKSYQVCNDIKEKFKKYILPNSYVCSYYRQSTPDVVDGRNIIKYFN